LVWHDNLAANTNEASDNRFIKGLPLTKSWVNSQDVSTDTTAPVINTVSYQDVNTNGTIDRVTVNVTEANGLL
jgi:hypothetical protein